MMIVYYVTKGAQNVIYLCGITTVCSKFQVAIQQYGTVFSAFLREADTDKWDSENLEGHFLQEVTRAVLRNLSTSHLFLNFSHNKKRQLVLPFQFDQVHKICPSFMTHRVIITRCCNRRQVWLIPCSGFSFGFFAHRFQLTSVRPSEPGIFVLFDPSNLYSKKGWSHWYYEVCQILERLHKVAV